MAERRAWIKALQSDIRRYKLQRKALASFAIDLTNMVQEVPENVCHRLDVHLAKYNKDIADAQEAIRILKQQEKTDIELREKILQRAKEKQ